MSVSYIYGLIWIFWSLHDVEVFEVFTSAVQHGFGTLRAYQHRKQLEAADALIKERLLASQSSFRSFSKLLEAFGSSFSHFFSFFLIFLFIFSIFLFFFLERSSFLMRKGSAGHARLNDGKATGLRRGLRVHSGLSQHDVMVLFNV